MTVFSGAVALSVVLLVMILSVPEAKKTVPLSPIVDLSFFEGTRK